MSTQVEAPPGVESSAALDTQTQLLLEALAKRMTQVCDLAHKINNPLTSVVGRAQLLRMKGQTDPNVLKALEVIEEATVRITAYVREVAQIVRDGKSNIVERLEAQATADRGSR